MPTPTIDLPELVKEENPRRRVLRLRPIKPTLSLQKKLARVYLGLMRIWAQAAKEAVERYRGDRVQDAAFADKGEWVSAVMTFAQASAEQYIEGQAARLLDEWGSDLVQWHARRLVGNLKYAGDLELSQNMLSPGGDTLANAVRYNVSLISDLSDEMRGKLEEVVFRGVQQRLPADAVAREIRGITGMGRARALRIAGDQTVKLTAALDRERDRELGFEEFVWRHSGKLHARIEHKERDGKRFRYDDPALVGDLPGDLPFCGCVAEPYMDLSDG